MVRTAILPEALLVFFLSLSCICSTIVAKATQSEAEAIFKWKASLISHSLTSWVISNHSSNNSSSPCEWDGIRCDIFGSVSEINLTNSNLNGTLHQFNFTILSNLTSLNLDSNNLSGQIPYQIGSLSKLITLDLGHNSFTGTIPNEIGELQELHVLHLYNNSLSGAIPYQLISNLQKVWDLDLSLNHLENPEPKMQFNGSMASLTHLRLYNNSLGLQFPTFIFQCHKLIFLDLSNNNIAGPIPTQLSPNNLNQLESLNLSSNLFEGHIPIEILNHTKLRALRLGYNKFNGSIPDEIGHLSNLRGLQLSNNRLQGPLPPSIAKLSMLQVLAIRNTSLSSIIPKELGRLSNLVALDLSENQISGSLPSEIGNLSQLAVLSLDDNSLLGSLPIEVGHLSNLVVLSIANNYLSGPLPFEIGNASKLVFINLSNNQLTGSLPMEVGKLSNLEDLELFTNYFTGSVPNSLSNINALRVLHLHGNCFHALPSSFQNASNLKSLIIHGNQIQGQVPRSLTLCEKIEILDLGNNMMYDTFPCWLESLPMLQVLSLRSNKFYGLIKCPRTKNGFQNLHFLDLSSNQFSGYLPKEFFQGWKTMRNSISSNESHLWNKVLPYGVRFTQDFYSYVTVPVISKGQYVSLNRSLEVFTFLDLSNNHFHGEIPEVIGELKSLVALNLSCNAFIGIIPSPIGNLSDLEALDLSQNKLSGEIPNQLTALTFLAVMNLSRNKLTGAIPHGNQFNTFSNDSYEGNQGLCGFPLSKQCKHGDAYLPLPTPDEDTKSTTKFDWKVMLMGYGSGVVIGFAIGYVMFGNDNRILAKIYKFLYDNRFIVRI